MCNLNALFLSIVKPILSIHDSIIRQFKWYYSSSAKTGTGKQLSTEFSMYNNWIEASWIVEWNIFNCAKIVATSLHFKPISFFLRFYLFFLHVSCFAFDVFRVLYHLLHIFILDFRIWSLFLSWFLVTVFFFLLSSFRFLFSLSCWSLVNVSWTRCSCLCAQQQKRRRHKNQVYMR